MSTSLTLSQWHFNWIVSNIICLFLATLRSLAAGHILTGVGCPFNLCDILHHYFSSTYHNILLTFLLCFFLIQLEVRLAFTYTVLLSVSWIRKAHHHWRGHWGFRLHFFLRLFSWSIIYCNHRFFWRQSFLSFLIINFQISCFQRHAHANGFTCGSKLSWLR